MNSTNNRTHTISTDKSHSFRAVVIRTCLLCKRLLKMPIIPIMLVAIPVMSFAISMFSGKDTSSDVCVGLYFDINDKYAEMIKENLCGKENAFTFKLYDDRDLMTDDVISGKLECGYIFDVAFTKAMEKGNFKNSVKTIVSPSTFFAMTINEIVFAAIIQVSGYEIIGNYIHTEDFAAYPDAEDYLYETYEAYCGGGDTFHLDIMTESGTKINDDTTSLGVTFPLRGMLAILIFLAGMIGCTAWLCDNEQGIFAPRPFSFKVTSRIVYPLLPALLFIICSELSLYISGLSFSAGKELLICVRYLALITIFSNLCIFFLKKSSIVISLIPVLVLGSLIFCPVFISLEDMIPALGFVGRLFLPRYFL